MDESAECAGFATKFSKKALALLRTLPSNLQQALVDVIAALVEDPDKYPHRNRAISRDGKVLVYTHPEPPLEVTYELDLDRRIIYFLHFAAPVLEITKRLFVSYSHQDKDWLNELRKWLKTLEKSDEVKIWDDREIEAGTKWRDEITRSLQSAEVAVLLVSQNFLASDFILEHEMPPLLEAAERRGLKILWIAVRRSAVADSPLKQYQALNDPSRPLESLGQDELDEAFHQIYMQIKQELAAGQDVH